MKLSTKYLLLVIITHVIAKTLSYLTDISLTELFNIELYVFIGFIVLFDFLDNWRK